MKRDQEKRQELKKGILQKMKHMQAGPKATPQQEIESLVKQAEYYTSFLLSKFESREK